MPGGHVAKLEDAAMELKEFDASGTRLIAKILKQEKNFIKL